MKSLNPFAVAVTLGSGLLLVAGLAAGHHSTIGQIADEVTEIVGTVKEFQFQNPHSWIQVNVTDENGDVEEWSVEWGNPNNLLRRGYNPSTFPAGAEVTMRLQRHVSGAPLGEFLAARFADGTTIGDWEGD